MPEKNQIILPGTTTTIYQPNRVTNARYRGFTLIQSKVFVSLIKQLQIAIRLDMEGKNWQQLDIFDSPDKRLFKVGIPLADIGKPVQYKEISESCQALTRLSIKIQPPAGYTSIATLAARVDIPVKERGRSIVYIYMLREVGEQLIKIDKSLNGNPEKFTRYIYEVAMRSKNKYTAKVYQIISSWKARGGLRVSYKAFREQLGIEENEYPEYSDFKRRVLIPVQEELENKADCWFLCNARGFVEREGKKVVRLNFKIITAAHAEDNNFRAENIRHLLRNHVEGFEDTHIERLSPIFTGRLDYQAVQLKLLSLKDWLEKNRGRDANGSAINDIASWVCTSLLNEFLDKC
jgi:hypothetical protein